MRLLRPLALVLTAVAGCADSHALDASLSPDDTGTDTPAGLDAGRPRDAGPDVPDASPDTGLALLDVGDPVDAPDAPPDAPTCGNGVLDDGEECDDAMFEGYFGCVGCVLTHCFNSYGSILGTVTCPPSLPWCVWGTDGRQVCRPDRLGGADPGEHCSADAECRTGRCSSDLARCTHNCFSDQLCTATTFCSRDVEDVSPYADGWCAAPCARTSDCQAGEICSVFDALLSTRFRLAACVSATWVPLDGPDRSHAGGTPCYHASECAAGACDQFVGCTELCVDDSDCVDAARPRCAELDPSIYWTSTPPGWTPLRACLSRCGDGVLDPGEQCDSGDRWDPTCPPPCVWPACVRSSECSGRTCSGVFEGHATCWLPNDAAGALGSPCVSDDECRSRFCGPVSGRCTVHCVDDTDCPGGLCDELADEGVTPGSPGWCTFPP